MVGWLGGPEALGKSACLCTFWILWFIVLDILGTTVTYFYYCYFYTFMYFIFLVFLFVFSLCCLFGC